MQTVTLHRKTQAKRHSLLWFPHSRTRSFTNVCFTCRFYMGVRRAQTSSRVNFRTIRLTCPLLLTRTYLQTYPCFCSSCFHYVLLEFQASRKSKHKTSQRGKTCTSSSAWPRDGQVCFGEAMKAPFLRPIFVSLNFFFQKKKKRVAHMPKTKC